MKNLKTFLLSLGIIGLSFASIYAESSDYVFTNTLDENGKVIESSVSDNDQIVKIKTGQAFEFPNKKIVKDYEDQRSKNKDTIGWLSIPNVGYYPILFSGDNQYYLNHNHLKKYYYGGAIFMNKFSEASFENTCLIHGHRMNNATMFGSLNKYEDPGFFRSNKLIEVFDGKNLRFYKPFSIFLMQDGFEFINQEKYPLNSEKRKYYLESIYERSIVPMEDGAAPDFGAETIFFSTCDYDFENARLVLAAYQVEKIPYGVEIGSEVEINLGNEIYDIFELKKS